MLARLAPEVDEHTRLVSVLEDDVARAVRLLGELCAQGQLYAEG